MNDKTELPEVGLCEVPLTCADLPTAVDWFIARLRARDMIGPLRFLNAYCFALADRDPSYKALLQGWGYNLPDGKPVAWLARKKDPTAGHVRGPSFFRQTIVQGVESGIRHFFFGTQQPTLDRLRTAVQLAAPGADIVGMEAPAFGPAESLVSDEVVQRIKNANPHVVWVGLGTPKQDHVGQLLSLALEGLPCVSIGAGFNFLAGVTKEAPLALQNCGLEWAYRLFSEPRRLWSRYTFGNVTFTKSVIVAEVIGRSCRHR